LNGADPRWVNVNQSVAQVPTKDGLLVRAVATSDQCCPDAEIADESGGVLGGAAPVLGSKGYKMGALGYCFSRSTSTGSMWNQAADLIPISKGTE
jgi:hypothetical protein